MVGNPVIPSPILSLDNESGLSCPKSTGPTRQINGTRNWLKPSHLQYYILYTTCEGHVSIVRVIQWVERRGPSDPSFTQIFTKLVDLFVCFFYVKSN